MQFVPSGRELPHKAEVTRGDCSTTPAAAMRSSPSESETSMTVGAGRPSGTGGRHGKAGDPETIGSPAHGGRVFTLDKAEPNTGACAALGESNPGNAHSVRMDPTRRGGQPSCGSSAQATSAASLSAEGVSTETDPGTWRPRTTLQ